MSASDTAPLAIPAAAPELPVATTSAPTSTPDAAGIAGTTAETPAPTVTAALTNVEEGAPEPIHTAESVPVATVVSTATVDAAAATTMTTLTDMGSSAPTPAATAAVLTETPAPVPVLEQTVNEDEPQSPLTKKFTAAEWEALYKFRADLAHVLEKAFPDKHDAKSTPVAIWGITLDPSGKKDARASVVLMKFLRARNLNPQAAGEMLVGTLRWRESFKIDKILEEKFPEDVFGALGKISGQDKEGRPIVYNIYGGNPDIKAVFSDVQRFIRWRVAFQERSLTLLDFTTTDQLLQIHDYAGVGLASRDANSKAAAAEASNIFNSHYPELLHRKFFINVPTFLSWIFWAFKAVVPAATFKKMSVVGSGEREIGKVLSEFVAEDQIPRRYGGGGDGW